jgi:hypothetical protein
VPFKNVTPSSAGTIRIGDSTLSILKDFIAIEGNGCNLKGLEVVFANNGWVDAETNDYKDLDVKGKIVVISLGSPKTKTPWESIEASEAKTKFAEERGAAAIIEIFTAKIPWKGIAGYFSSTRLQLDMKKEGEAKSTIPHIWLNGSRSTLLSRDKVSKIDVEVSDKNEKPVFSYNVAGVLEGTDPTLKNEYIVLSAHYDHVGTGKNGGSAYTPEDSIFNGARDNAFGTTAVLFAAKCLTDVKPKRSILFLGFTGEEVGLLGSKFYAENPLVPLKQCVYNLNCDGAGYTDTTILTMFGLVRTDCEGEIRAGAGAFGLKVIDDPAPEQNLFDRSDNVSFAIKGIPAPTFSPGFTAFDDAMFKFYHQASDNPESISFGYLHKYSQAYAHTARLIANRKTQPKWMANDKYEPAYKVLYGK